MSLKVARFIEANKRSPIVYASLVPGGWTYRLADDTVWTLRGKELREVEPRFARVA